MKKGTGVILTVLLFLVAPIYGFAIGVDDLQDLSLITPQTLAIEIGGSSVVPGSAVFTGAPIAAGTFRNGLADGLDIDRGIILTNGDILRAIGPNGDGLAGMDNSLPGDAQLNSLSSNTVDATVLEFDIIPTQSAMTFNYVFASDEYPFTNESERDVAGIFVNGVNIARVPGTNAPVTIQNLNGTVTPSLFRDNSELLLPPFGTQYDGFSTVLGATAFVQPGVAAHVKIAIADVRNGSVDSAVFVGPVLFSQAPATFFISGKVTTAGSRGVAPAPIPGVTLTVQAGNSTVGTATTDTNGNYTVLNLVAGTYTVIPSLAGFTFSPANRTVLISNASAQNINFTGAGGAPAPTFSITGRVATSASPGPSVPIAGVTVTVTSGGSPVGAATTDANGNYIVAGLQNGTYAVTPSNAGYTFSPVSSTVVINNASVQNVNFTGTAVVVTTFAVSGRVTALAGRLGTGLPLSGVTMTVTSGGTTAGTAVTDGNGNYTVGNLGNGSYRITPTKAGSSFTPVFRDITINNANITGINFTSP